MAKELPYFRFTPQEWQNGDISLESYAVKGLFIDVCSYYWVQDCVVTKKMLVKKFRNARKNLQELIELGILKHDSTTDEVVILYLNKQYDLLSKNRIDKQNAGRQGGLKKSSNAKAELKQNPSYKDKDKENDKDNLGSDEPPTPQPKVFNFKTGLVDYGFKKELVTDWIKVRKTKRATNTETAYNGFIKIIENSSRDKNEILQTCVEHSWTSYKDSWYDNLNKENGGNQKSSGTTSGGSRATSQVADSYE